MSVLPTNFFKIETGNATAHRSFVHPIENLSALLETRASARTAQKTFKELFCHYFKCPPEHFQEAAFARCIHRKPAFVVWCARSTESESFLAAMALIKEAGETRTQDQLEDLVEEYRAWNSESGPKSVRISTTRLLQLHSKMRNDAFSGRLDVPTSGKPFALLPQATRPGSG